MVESTDQFVLTANLRNADTSSVFRQISDYDSIQTVCRLL